MDRFLLCPFCGRSDMNEVLHTEQSESGSWFVLCDEARGGCGAQGGKADTEEQAVSRWNDRHDLEED